MPSPLSLESRPVLFELHELVDEKKVGKMRTKIEFFPAVRNNLSKACKEGISRMLVILDAMGKPIPLYAMELNLHLFSNSLVEGVSRNDGNTFEHVN